MAVSHCAVLCRRVGAAWTHRVHSTGNVTPPRINHELWRRLHSSCPSRDPPDFNIANPPDYEVSEEVTDLLDDHTLDKTSMTQLNISTTSQDPRDLLEERRTIKKGRSGSYKSELSELETLPIMHVRSTFNNTHINICDNTGKILTWKSAGSEGYKHSRKGTSFAAQAVGLSAALKARELGIHKVRVKLKGPGSGRQHSLKGFELGGLEVASIQDVTPVPHNGCKPKKKRRI